MAFNDYQLRQDFAWKPPEGAWQAEDSPGLWLMNDGNEIVRLSEPENYDPYRSWIDSIGSGVGKSFLAFNPEEQRSLGQLANYFGFDSLESMLQADSGPGKFAYDDSKYGAYTFTPDSGVVKEQIRSYNPADTGLDKWMPYILAGAATAGLGSVGAFGGAADIGAAAGGAGAGVGGGAGGVAGGIGGLSAETASWLASAGYAPEQIASIGSMFGADGALAGITGTGLDAMGTDWYSKMTPADLGLDASPFSTNPSFADLGGTAGTAGGSSILDSIKNLFSPNAGSAASLLGKLGLGALSAYGTNQQANALQNTANQYQAMGAPYRQRLADLYANPSGFLSSPEVQVPVQQGTDALARSLSIKGNPAGSGNALQQLQSYSADQLFGKLGQEKDRLAGFGGLANYNAAAPATQNAAINANGQTMTNLGGTINDIFSPPKTTAQSLADFMKLLK